MNAICSIKVVQIVTVLIFAVYALATSLPTLALSLRQFSSPIFIILILNTSIFLLSIPRFLSTTPLISSSSDAVVSSPIVTEIENEFGKAVVASTEDTEIEIEVSMTEMFKSSNTQSVVEEDVVDILEKVEEATMSSTENSGSVSVEEEEDGAEVSDAEFNRLIEAFLEKQKRFHYQENISILV